MKNSCEYHELLWHIGHNLSCSKSPVNSDGAVDCVLKCVDCDMEILRIDEPRVVINVNGGVADLGSKPSQITVEIHDYDIDGADEDKLAVDDDGDEYRLINYPCKREE